MNNKQKKAEEEVDLSLISRVLKLYLLDAISAVVTWITKYPPFSSYGRQYLFHYDNQKYWLFWEKMVKDWYQIYIKHWEQDNYFVYFYCGLDYPKREGRLEEVQKHIDKRVGEGVVAVTSYENKILTLRVNKGYFE